MKAIVYNKFGSPKDLSLKEVPTPKCGPYEVMIKVRAVGLNPLDNLVIGGKMKPVISPSFPATPGYDLAGEVVSVGRRTNKFRIGDRVFCMLSLLKGGALSEYICLPEKRIEYMPINATFEEAAAMPLAGLTALQGLRDKGYLNRGDKVLLHGATGGVGVFATQLAKLLGADVWATCSAKNHDFVKELGARVAMDYHANPPHKLNEQFDIVYDIYGNLPYPQAKKLLFKTGFHVTTIPTMSNFFRQLSSTFTLQKTRMVVVSPQADDLNILREYHELGLLKSYIDSVWALEDTSRALEHLASKHCKGKVVVKM